MKKILLSDLGEVLAFAKDSSYQGRLSDLHQQLASQAAYSPADHFRVNTELLTFLKQQPVECMIFTAGIVHTLPGIGDQLSSVFTRVITETEVGGSKKESATFIKAAQLLQKSPEDIVFIDDNPRNVAAAQAAGVTAFQFVSTEQIISDLKKVFG